jgi:hypothetical protein
MFPALPNTKKLFLECHLPAYICMRPSLMPEQLDGFYSCSLFKNLCIVGQCLVNMNILAPKIEALQMGPKNTKLQFSQTVILIKFK